MFGKCAAIGVTKNIINIVRKIIRKVLHPVEDVYCAVEAGIISHRIVEYLFAITEILTRETASTVSGLFLPSSLSCEIVAVVKKIDARISPQPICYMTNCVQPTNL